MTKCNLKSGPAPQCLISKTQNVPHELPSFSQFHLRVEDVVRVLNPDTLGMDVLSLIFTPCCHVFLPYITGLT